MTLALRLLRAYTVVYRALRAAQDKPNRKVWALTPETFKRRRRRRILALKRPVDVAFMALPQRLRARIRRREWWWMRESLKRMYSKRKIETLMFASPVFGLLPKVAP